MFEKVEGVVTVSSLASESIRSVEGSNWLARSVLIGWMAKNGFLIDGVVMASSFTLVHWCGHLCDDPCVARSGIAPSPTSTSHPSTRLSALDPTFSAFAAQPLPKTDRVAAMRAAKAAIQGAQQQQLLQLYGSHSLPPQPAQAQLPRPTSSTSANWQAAPMSSSAGGSSSGGVGDASGNGGGGGSVGGRKLSATPPSHGHGGPPWGLSASNFNHILVVTHFPDMPDCLSSIIRLPLVERLGRRAPGRGSQSSLSLFCSLPPTGESIEPTNGVPIVNMLAHSPPLPLAIDYHEEDRRETTKKDEEGILLALRHIDRVHYIGLFLPTPKLRKIITTMDEQFPILERLNIPPIAYFPPGYLLTRLSLMPQLEFLSIRFCSPPPNGNVESQMFDTPIMTPITLPNLRWFSFKGVSAYLEDLLARISAPALIDFHIVLLTLVVPRLLQFMGTSETLHLTTVRLNFGDHGFVLRSDERMVPFCLRVHCIHAQWWLSSTVQSLTALQPVLSGVEQLVLSHEGCQSWSYLVERTLWHELLRPFSNLKKLHVQNELVDEHSFLT
ncbi:hypothetical protein BJV78DRAFT_1158213 [Lactifluus subvellereus]|nr:hypothetical protein BJV78DRAFT_1158213 [Lactifluus subvellereus]